MLETTLFSFFYFVAPQCWKILPPLLLLTFENHVSVTVGLRFVFLSRWAKIRAALLPTNIFMIYISAAFFAESIGARTDSTSIKEANLRRFYDEASLKWRRSHL